MHRLYRARHGTHSQALIPPSGYSPPNAGADTGVSGAFSNCELSPRDNDFSLCSCGPSSSPGNSVKRAGGTAVLAVPVVTASSLSSATSPASSPRSLDCLRTELDPECGDEGSFCTGEGSSIFVPESNVLDSIPIAFSVDMNCRRMIVCERRVFQLSSRG